MLLISTLPWLVASFLTRASLPAVFAYYRTLKLKLSCKQPALIIHSIGKDAERLAGKVPHARKPNKLPSRRQANSMPKPITGEASSAVSLLINLIEVFPYSELESIQNHDRGVTCKKLFIKKRNLSGGK